MRVDREKRKRADGTEIDSVKNLADYVQSFPISGESDDAPEAVAAPVIPIAPVVAQPDTNAELERLREESKRSREEAQRYQAELAGHKTRQEAEAAARRVMAEQQRPAPQAPAVDPRIKEVDRLWFDDQPKARALLQEIQRDEMRKELETQRAAVKQEVFTELTTQQRKERANLAYSTAMIELQKRGVKPEQITRDRVNALYATVTRPPTANAPNAYYDAGGPLNDQVLMTAWGDLYGIPNGGDAGTGQVAGGLAPVAAAPTVVPVPVAPPGSSRPAPAATPPRQASDRQPALSANDQRDIDHMAKTFGYDADKMKARRRDRLSRERG